MPKLNPEEEARRRHNKRVRLQRKLHKAQVEDTKEIVEEIREDLTTHVPIHILSIIENIIETQNKGVPLSPFQKETIEKLEKSLKNIDSDELRKPRIISTESGMVVKDIHVQTPDGQTNLTSFKAPGAYEGQTINTLLPLGDTTYELIDMIADVLSENARLVEQLNKQEKEKAQGQELFTEKYRENKDTFQNKIMDLAQINHDGNTKSSKTINMILANIFADYNEVRDSTLNIYTDGSENWLGDVPIVDHGDKENIDPNAETVGERTARHEMFKVEIPNDVQLIQMLPKNITEQLIEVLSRAIQENSELHNQLYKADKIQRKFPTKLLMLVGSLATAIALLLGLTRITIPERHETTQAVTQQDTKTDDAIQQQEENVLFNPKNIKNNIQWAQTYLIKIKAYGAAIKDPNIAADIYQQSAENYDSLLENRNVETFLGNDYKKLSYGEMTEGFDAVIEDFESGETAEFINKLIEKSEATKKNGVIYTAGSLSFFNLTEEEYERYKELESISDNLKNSAYYLESSIASNETFNKIINNETVKMTEKDFTNMLIGAGAGVASSAFLGSLALIVINAKKKEKLRELERAQAQSQQKNKEV